MTPSLLIACLWVVASAVVAMLPMRRQYRPGVVLFLAAPLIILWVGYDFGWLFIVLALFGFVSMFRHPLRYFYRKFLGLETEMTK